MVMAILGSFNTDSKLNLDRTLPFVSKSTFSP